MRLMQRSERDVALEAVQHVFRNENRLIEFRATMHDAMADGDGIDVKLVAEPRARRVQRCRNVRHGFIRVGSLDQNLTFSRLRGQMRLGPDAFDFALDLAADAASLIDGEDFELDA
jgi:hypothetical protein